MSQRETFSIRQLVELTGLSEFTLRGWETRYSAFEPQRTETGRREYSKADVERALLLREMLKRGHKIGKVAKLNNHKLKILFEKTERADDGQRCAGTSIEVREALELVALQKWSELEVLIKKIQRKGTSQLINDFFLPALRSLSANIDAGLVSISQEHIFSAFLKEKIYAAISALDAKRRKALSSPKIRFVLATPEGDYHETGLLMAHLSIRANGFTSLYVGPHSPAQDLSETALRFNASHVLIVSTVSRKGGAKQELLAYISDLQARVGSHLQILVAGGQAPISIELNPSLSIMRSFYQFEEYLKNMEAQSG